MLQQTPYLLLTRPLAFFGTFEQLEEELSQGENSFDEEEYSEQWGFMCDANKIKPFDQRIGLFIHWFEN